MEAFTRLLTTLLGAGSKHVGRNASTTRKPLCFLNGRRSRRERIRRRATKAISMEMGRGSGDLILFLTAFGWDGLAPTTWTRPQAIEALDLLTFLQLWAARVSECQEPACGFYGVLRAQ